MPHRCYGLRHQGRGPGDMKSNLMVLAAACFAWAMLPTAAHAEYRFCNNTSYVLDSAIAFDNGDAWTSRGWVRLPPGDCGTAFEGPVAERDYYVFARSIDAHEGSVKYFSGNERFCVIDRDFEIAGRDQCAIRGYDSADFLRVSAKAGESWTTAFSEASEYTPDKARIAGAQRLLKDIGFPLKLIDGIAARNTLRSVEAFQRSENIRVTGVIDSRLIDQMIGRALAEQEKTGLNFCNETANLVWAAVGYRNASNDMSSGWIRIEPGTCRKAIRGKLTEERYFLYAEAVDKAGALMRRDGQPLVWEGNESFCTKTTRFEIKGRARCAARGFDEHGFMPVETGGKERWNADLE